MFKILLSLYVSMWTFASYGQSIPSDSTGQVDKALEDPEKNIGDLNAIIADNGKIHLNWKVNGKTPDFFSIERSDNGKNFETVAILNNITPVDSYQWTDDAPKKGKTFYRIRYSFKEEPAVYSKMVPVSIAGYTAFKFYPNPVDHILIVRSDAPVDVQISDATGRIRISQPRVQGIYTINVSSLEKGVYLIRFSNKLTNLMTQEKLIKN